MDLAYWLIVYYIIPIAELIFIPLYAGRMVYKWLVKRRSTAMPVGTITNTTSDKLALNTAPPDGYVIVRRMTYGEEMHRSSLAARFLMGGTSSKDFTGELDIQSEKVTLWDFANLVVEHNITDASGRVLNFKNEQDVRSLDVRVGKEIGQYIDDFNATENTDEVKN